MQQAFLQCVLHEEGLQDKRNEDTAEEETEQIVPMVWQIYYMEYIQIRTNLISGV